MRAGEHTWHVPIISGRALGGMAEAEKKKSLCAYQAVGQQQAAMERAEKTRKVAV